MGSMTTPELQLARLLWELQIQHEHYSEVIYSQYNNMKYQLNTGGYKWSPKVSRIRS